MPAHTSEVHTQAHRIPDRHLQSYIQPYIHIITHGICAYQLIDHIYEHNQTYNRPMSSHIHIQLSWILNKHTHLHREPETDALSEAFTPAQILRLNSSLQNQSPKKAHIHSYHHLWVGNWDRLNVFTLDGMEMGEVSLVLGRKTFSFTCSLSHNNILSTQEI